MLLFLPFEDFDETARSLYTPHIVLPINQAFILLKSFARCYEPNPRTGQSGFEFHTVAKFWEGHEMSLVQYGMALTKEMIRRHTGGADTLQKLKERLRMWLHIQERLEDAEWPDTPPELLGDEEFHSAFRAYLLYKGCQIETYKIWKSGGYPDHISTRNLLPRKTSWKRSDYERIWEFFGQPKSYWYGTLGWSEEPNDLLMFLSEDKRPQIKKEIQRKIDKPMVGYLMKNKVDLDAKFT